MKTTAMSRAVPLVNVAFRENVSFSVQIMLEFPFTDQNFQLCLVCRVLHMGKESGPVACLL